MANQLRPEKLRTTKQLTEIVPGTTIGYWNQLRYTGNGPAFFRPSPRVILYDIDIVLAWVQDSQRTSTAEVGA